MTGFFEVVGGALALLGFIAAVMWIFTPKRAPARRMRRGGGAILLFCAAVAAYVLSGQLS